MSQNVMHGTKMPPQRQQSRRRPSANGFALSPYVPFSRTAFVGLSKLGGEVMCSFTIVPHFRSAGRDAPVRPRKHNVCAQGPQMIMGFIHNPHHCADQIGAGRDFPGPLVAVRQHPDVRQYQRPEQTLNCCYRIATEQAGTGRELTYCAGTTAQISP
jgi:hypothetical protein